MSITGNEAEPFKTYDIVVTVDSRHRDNPVASYLWVSDNGTVMETPLYTQVIRLKLEQEVFGDLVLNRLQMLIWVVHLPLHLNINRFSTDYWKNISEDDYEIETI